VFEREGCPTSRKTREMGGTLRSSFYFSGCEMLFGFRNDTCFCLTPGGIWQIFLGVSGSGGKPQVLVMWKLRFALLCISLVALLVNCRAQSSSAPKAVAKKVDQQSTTGHLAPVETIVSPSELASGFDQPFTCDNNGNLYLQSERFGTSGVRKINLKGERTVLFRPSANPEFRLDGVGSFALSPSGELYQIVFPHEITRYVMVFKSDGTYKSTIKMQPGFGWIPSTLTVFSSGDLLASGLRYDRDRNDHVMWPFTGIFSSDGALLKEVSLEDDDDIRKLAASGDARVSSTSNPSANFAVEFGQSEPAEDGNIYLMRWITPTIFYAISPGGEVVRRFVVDPGDDNAKPAAMHIAGNRIAVLFYRTETQGRRMKIVDLEGHEIATYDEMRAANKATEAQLGAAFACYTVNPQRFTFLNTGEGDRIEIQAVEGR
jgi:hypothetical protein